MVIAKKQVEHVTSGEEFASSAHLATFKEFTYVPGPFQYSSRGHEDSKTPQAGFDLCPDWLRASPFR